MITFIIGVALLFWAVRFCDLPAWGWWLGLLVLGLFVDVLLEGLAHLAPRPPGVYGAKSAAVQDAEGRLEAMRESTRRTIEASDRIAAEIRDEREKHDAEGRGL